MQPLAGIRVVGCASGAAAGYALRMLATLGADALLVEPEGGTALRSEPALFAYLTAGVKILPGTGRGTAGTAVEGPGAASVQFSDSRFSPADPSTASRSPSPFRGGFEETLTTADIFLHDTPLADREALSLDEASITARHPNLIHVSILPFGASGPKAGWKGEDINILHASGEGYLLPNGLSTELFPDREPVKPYGHFCEYQGGTAAALGALTALWARDDVGGQYVDISAQDATLAVGAFAIQRLGDGSVEHRVERSFRYGGVIECADGYVELLTLEQRQWEGLVDLLGNPDWAQDPVLESNIERSHRGAEINGHIRAWAKVRKVEDVVREGQKRNVPLGKYMSPDEVLASGQAEHRGLFQAVDGLPTLVSPFHFDGVPLAMKKGDSPLFSGNEKKGTVPFFGGAR